MVSAALFALAHVVVQGKPAAILIFLPGVVLGWLYMKTGTLLAPILFHGLANVFWQLTTGPVERSDSQTVLRSYRMLSPLPQQSLRGYLPCAALTPPFLSGR